jgi:hypothetical protein
MIFFLFKIYYFLILNIPSNINKSDENLSAKLDVINDSIFSLENKILEVKTNGDTASELGSLKYLSELIGVEMNRIVNWLLLVIIFVFDPLAISLVIAANVVFAQLRNTPISKLTKDEEPKPDIPIEVDSKTDKLPHEKIENMRKLVESYDNLKNIPDPTQYNASKNKIISNINKEDNIITYF